MVEGAAGCGDDDSSEGANTSTGTTQVDTGEAAAGGAAAATGTTIKLADSQYGRILFGGNDQAIYLFDKESSAKPDCYGACAEAWPPVLTKGEPQASGGARTQLLGTTRRADGTTQVT